MKKLVWMLLLWVNGWVCWGGVWYVDRGVGHDGYAGTVGRPKKTIQAAVSAASAGDVIYVGPGTYAPFRVERPMVIIGVKGALHTVVDGSLDGVNQRRYRCVEFGGVEGYELHGFTLQNGYSERAHGGGAWKGTLRRCVVKNCGTFAGNGLLGGGGCYQSVLWDSVVEGCRAGFGGALAEGVAYRCTFRNNYAWDRGGALWNSEAHESLIHDNVCDCFGGLPGGGGAQGSRLYNCTVTRNEARRLQGAGGLYGCWSYNCIVWGNVNLNYPSWHDYRDFQARQYDHFGSDPRFRGGMNFHLRHDSPCRRVGNPSLWHGGAELWDRDCNPRFHAGLLDIGCYQEDEELNSVRENGDGTYRIRYNPCGEEWVSVTLDGVTLLSDDEAGEFVWQPQSMGVHTNVFTYGLNAETSVVTVVELPYAVQEDPVPPMALDPSVVITPATRNVKQGGAGYTVTTTGSSASWEATASAEWILVSQTTGAAGMPVPYTVGINTNAETRVGYVYVSGHVHTITQAGVGSVLSDGGAEFECDGGEGEVELTIRERHAWTAHANCDWISVATTNGVGSGTVRYTVAPLYDVTTRSGEITIGGNTYTVFQYGRRMGLSPVTDTRDYYTHIVDVGVDALALTEYTVTPNNSWISVVSITSARGSSMVEGKGEGLVALAISENPSFAERTGTVSIGTETFRITQSGRTDVRFEMDPVETTGSANGANGRIAIEATPDLPWVAQSEANWLTIASGYETGAGNGNVAYTVFPNTTVEERVGRIVVTPDASSGLTQVVHRVTQPAAMVALSSFGEEYQAPGEAKSVSVTVSKNVQWRVVGVEDVPWLTVVGPTDYVGPAVVTLAASANDTIFERVAQVVIAGKAFTVTQRGRGVEISYESRVFDTEGGMDSISVYPDGNVSWQAVASDPTWISFPWGDSGMGYGELVYVLSDYVGDGYSRSGTITIGNHVVKVTQTAYPVNISPMGSTVAGNSGAGEFSVAADLGAIWNAIATEPWITVEVERRADGGGRVQFFYTDNNSGKTRSGKIEINGTEYTLTQQARTMVAVHGAVDGHGGDVSNVGSYDLGTSVRLTAVPDAGYRFLYWTLPDATESMVNPLTVVADVPKTYTAKFAPLAPVLTSVESGTDGVQISWQSLAWALTYHIYRGSTSVPSEAVKIDSIPNTGITTYLDVTGTIDHPYFYWVQAEGLDDVTMSPEALVGTHEKLLVYSPIFYKNVQGASHTNPTTYLEEVGVVFSYPTSTVEGYTFAGWSPASIGTEVTGPVIVEARWTPNAYLVQYEPNGAVGTMPYTQATYDEYLSIPACAFVREGYTFVGWALSPEGEAAFAAGDSVRNLTSAQNEIVTLYAIWEADAEPVVAPADPVIVPGDGSRHFSDSVVVSLSCTTPGAILYYSTTGSTPKTSASYLYAGPFVISRTTRVIAVAVKDGLKSGYAQATITLQPLTLADALQAPTLPFVSGGALPWKAVVLDDATGSTGAQSGAIGDDQETWLETTLSGAGTLSFDWRVDCEYDDAGFCSWDHVTLQTNGVEVARMDGNTPWSTQTLSFGEGSHTVRWIYRKDESDASGTDAAWLRSVTWVPAASSDAPSITDDPTAQISGSAETGYVVRPSADKTNVEVRIPAGLEPTCVTVEVSTSVERVHLHGAALRIVKGAHEITDYLDLPAPETDGSLDLTKACVKPAIAKEVFNRSLGAIVQLDPENPSLTTAPTRPGLTYTFREGRELTSLETRASILGDGLPWSPQITVKGGNSAFYSIRVTK